MKNAMESRLIEAVKTSCVQEPSIQSRVFKISHTKNCNDEVLRNMHIQEFLENMMKKYNIADYIIQPVDNKNEYGFELILNNTECTKLYQ